MIPLATTSISVLRPVDSDVDNEPYVGEDDRFTVAATGVRAVVDRPSSRSTGREQRAGGEQISWDFELMCDPIELGRLDRVRDDADGIVYLVVWVWTPLGLDDHMEAGLRIVEGGV